MTQAVDDFHGSGGGGSSSTPQRTPDNLLSQDYAEIILGLCSGPIKGLVSDVAPHGPLENFFFGDTPLQNIADQKSNFADFKVTQYPGNADDPEIQRVLGGDASNLTVNTHMLQNIAVIRTTPPNLRKTDTFAGLDRIEVRILFNTIVKQTDEGTFDAEAMFQLSYKPSNSPTWLNYNNQASTSITGKTTSGYVKDFLIDVEPLTDTDYDIRLTKLSPDNGTETAIDFTWESIQMVTLGKPRYEGLALLHIYGKVTAQFSSLPDMSGIYDLQILQVPTNYNPDTRTYDETVPWDGTFKLAWSNNPAWVLWYLINNTEKGLARYYTHVAANRGEFYTAAKWCDEQVPSGVVGVTQPRFTFNEVFTDQRLGLELLTYVAGAFNSTIYDSGNGIIRLKTDQLTTPKMIFTPENVTDGIFNYSFTDITTRPNDITVQFINPALNWNTDERSASIDASEWIEQNGRIPLDFQAVGCTDLHEAIRRANDRLLTANTEITQVTMETTRFGMLCELYDVIYVADPVSGWSTGGRIKSYANGVIQLRDPIFFDSQVTANLKIQTYNGLVDIGVTPPQIGLVYSLNVVSGVYPENTVPDRTVFTVENTSNLGLAKPFRVSGIIEVEGKPDKYSITAIEMNPNKYTDSANGTKSDPIKYDFETPGEPVLPLTLDISNLLPAVSSDGTLIYRINVEWVRPFQAYTEFYELEYQEKGTSVWELYKVYGESQEVKPLKDGSYYNFRLWAISPTGQRSSKAVQVYDWLVVKKNSILENVTGLTLNKGNKGWVASWNPPVEIFDLAGTRIKFSNPPKSWEELGNLYLSPSNEQELPWFIAGSVRVHAKYINTSGNESSDSSLYNLTVLAPSAPVVTVSSSFGSNILTFTDPTTTQPLSQVLVKKGDATSTWDNAAISSFTLGTNQRTFSVSPDATQATRVFLRAIDVAGNQGAITLVEIPAGANSVQELLDAVKGDIDETWITPGLLNHINFGDPEVVGGLADQINQIKKVNAQFDPFYTSDWIKQTNTTDWMFYNGTGTLVPEGTLLNAGAADPILRSPVLNMLGKTYDKVRVKIKRVGGTGWDGSLFFSTTTRNNENGARYILTPDPTILNDWVIIDYPMAGVSDWSTSTISQVRFDFGVDANDDFIVEYISFGKYGVGLTQAEFKNAITTLANQDTAFSQQLTTLTSTVTTKIGGILNADPFCTDVGQWIFGRGVPTSTLSAIGVTDGASGATAFSILKTASDNSVELVSKPILAGSNKTMRLSLQVRTPQGNGGFYARLHYYDRNGSLLGYLLNPVAESLYPPTPGWLKIAGMITTPSNVSYIQIHITPNNFSTTYPAETQVQDVRVEDVSESVTLAALVQTEATTRADQTGFLAANWTTRVSLNLNGQPVIGGISLAGTSSPTQGPTFDMSIRSNKIAFLPPAGLSADTPTYPFIYYTTATVLPSGITVQPGLYTKNAFIEYVTADQIDTRGLTIKDYSGNVLFSSTQNLNFTRITAASNWLNANQAWAEVSGDDRPTTGLNLLKNGTFETGVQDWALKHANNAAPLLTAVNAGDAFSGTGVMELGGTAACVSSRAVGVTPGKRYRVRFKFRALVANVEGFWYMGFSSAKPSDGFNGYPDCPQWIPMPAPSESLVIAPGSVWQTYDQILTVPASRQWASIAIHRWYNSGPGARLQIDEVILTEYVGDLDATLGATFGVNVFGKINSGNASTFIDNAAINYAMIQYILASQISTTSLSAISATIGTLQTATSGQRLMLQSNYLAVYNSANLAQVELGIF